MTMHRLLIERAGRFQIWQVGHNCDVLVCRPGEAEGTYIRSGDIAEVVAALAQMLGENLRAEMPRCTGAKAVWCPAHGHCICPERDLDAVTDEYDFSNEKCPLHGANTNHATEEGR